MQWLMQTIWGSIEGYEEITFTSFTKHKSFYLQSQMATLHAYNEKKTFAEAWKLEINQTVLNQAVPSYHFDSLINQDLKI